MALSTNLYETLGFERLYGGPEERLTSYKAGASFLNLALSARDGHELSFAKV